MPEPSRDFDGDACARFIAATAGRPTPPLLLRALEAAPAPAPGARALELGCGAGDDAVLLAERGYRVTVIDEFAEAIDAARALGEARRVGDRLELHRVRFERFDFPAAAFDVVHARFALPFCPPAEFGSLFAGVTGALRPGGVFAFQLFGPRDTFVTEPGRTRITGIARDELLALLAPLHVIECEEDEKDGHTATGRAKHWHVHHCLVKRPAG